MESYSTPPSDPEYVKKFYTNNDGDGQRTLDGSRPNSGRDKNRIPQANLTGPEVDPNEHGQSTWTNSNPGWNEAFHNRPPTDNQEWP